MNLYETVYSQMKPVVPKKLYWAYLVKRRSKFWREAGVIFIHIPKNGGTSINQALYGQFMGHYSASTVAKHAPKLFANLPSLAVSRNPWDRCASAYRFAKIDNSNKDKTFQTPAIKADKVYQSTAFDTFERFVCDWLPQQDLKKVDFVFQSQMSFVDAGDTTPMVTNMGRIEDLTYVQKLLTDYLGRNVEIGHTNRTGKVGNYRDLYTKQMRDIVGDVYGDDVKGFNYDF